MAQYYVTGSITYSNTNNRNTAYNAINNVLANYPTVTGVATTYIAGVNFSGTTVTVSLLVPDEATMESLRVDLLGAWTAGTRSNVFIASTRDGA